MNFASNGDVVCFSPQSAKPWCDKLFGHFEHTTFVFDDSPQKLTIGFKCPCNGDNRTWSIRLNLLRALPFPLRLLLEGLHKRENSPNTPWFLHQMARQQLLMQQGDHRRGLAAQVLEIDQKLRQHVRPGRREKLKKRKAKLMKFMAAMEYV